jgi:hypothetical protein
VEHRIPHRVVWRRRLLERAGFPRPLAWSLAGDERENIQSLIELVEQGCEPATAVRLTAPPSVERRPC